MFETDIPDDLLQLQLAVLRAEHAYQNRIAALYAHPLMRRARDEGLLDKAAAELRSAARAA